MNDNIHMSILPCLAFWRPLGLLALLLTGVMGLVDLAQYGRLMAPREPFTDVLIIITTIEAFWHLGRTVYDAWPGVAEIGAAVVMSMADMSVRYFGFVSLLVSVSAMASGMKDTSIGPYVALVELAIFSGICVIEVALIAVHWKGQKGAKHLFGRLRKIVESKGKNVDAVVGTSGASK